MTGPAAVQQLPNPYVTAQHLAGALRTIMTYATNVEPANFTKAVAMLALIKTIASDALERMPSDGGSS